MIFSAECQEKSTNGWVQIFNGTNLDGWTPKFKGSPMGVDYKNTFHVENGLLKVDYSQYTNFNGEFGHLFWKEKLSHYIIRAEYRFIGEQCPGGPTWGFRNNGIMIFSEPRRTRWNSTRIFRRQSKFKFLAAEIRMAIRITALFARRTRTLFIMEN